MRSRASGTASGLCRHRAASSMIREMIGGGTAALCARNPSPEYQRRAGRQRQRRRSGPHHPAPTLPPGSIGAAVWLCSSI